jgi:hypothetical protein
VEATSAYYYCYYYQLFGVDDFAARERKREGKKGEKGKGLIGGGYENVRRIVYRQSDSQTEIPDPLTSLQLRSDQISPRTCAVRCRDECGWSGCFCCCCYCYDLFVAK